MARARLRTLLLPGLDGSGRLFDPLLAAAPRAFEPRVVALPSEGAATYDRYQALLLESLPRRGSWALLAESFSGPLAVRIAAARPRGLVAVALVSTFLHRPLGRWLAPLGPLVHPPLFAVPLLPPAIRFLLVGPSAPDELVAAVQRAVADVPAEVMAGRARQALDADVRRELAATEVPLLYLGAADDRLLRTDVAQDILALRPDADARVLPGPHALLQARPRECLEVLEPFYAGARGRS
jgi:pimeloyl-ACP methyl ester carboxylesterase